MAVVASLFVLGLLLTVRGGDLFVDGAVWVAEAWGIPMFLVGATVVSVATTLPELAVSLLAAARGSNAIAACNAVGSVAANLGLILGLTACASPCVAPRGGYGAKLMMMLGAAVLLRLVCSGGMLGPWGALSLLSLCAAYLFESVAQARENARAGAAGHEGVPARAAWTNAAKLALGGLAIALGARLMCDCGATLARRFGVGEGVIGATLIAVGTSLPELVTALAALRRGEASLGVGNIVGANIIDLTLILPMCAFARGGSLVLPAQSLALDMPFCLALALVATGTPLDRERFTRMQGVALLGIFAGYMCMMASSA